MAGDYTNLKDLINDPTQYGLPAWDNGAKEIEGLTIKQYLLSIINSLTVGYQFMGGASEDTSGGTPDQNVFYIAGAGTYNGFGSDTITIDAGYIGIIRWNGAWSSDTIKIADPVSVSQNSETGHTDINIGDNSYPVPSVEELENAVAEIGLKIENGANDLFFSDEEGYILVYLKDGHIITKRFNSKNTVTLNDFFEAIGKVGLENINFGKSFPFAVSDENKNIITFFKDGYFHTPNGLDFAQDFFDFSVKDSQENYLVAVKGKEIYTRLKTGYKKKRVYITGNINDDIVNNLKLKHSTDNIFVIPDLQQTFVDAAKTGNCAVEKIIYVCGPLEYDMFTGMGGADWFTQMIAETEDGAPWYDYNAIMENVHIIGMGQVKIKLDCTGYSNFIVSAINVKGNAIIENISIETIGCRYPIHDQVISSSWQSEITSPSLNGGKSTHRIYRNVNTQSGSRGLNCGFADDTNVVIENCNFRCTTGSNRAFTFHGTNVNIDIQNSIIDGGYFHSEGVDLRFVANIANSFINGDFNTAQEGSSSEGIQGNTDYGVFVIKNSYVKNGILRNFANIINPIDYINRVENLSESIV